MRRATLLMSILLCICGCHDSDDVLAPDAGLGGVYHYRGFEPAGVMSVEGALSIQVDGTLQVSGAWSLSPVGSGPAAIEHPVGTGELIGHVVDDQISLNLHPGINDANLYLDGTIVDGAFAGEWSWVTLLGTVAAGEFVADRTTGAL